MIKLSYSEQLKHPNWQRKRLEMLEAASWECTNCGDKDSMLHVHHRRYVKGRMAWEYDDPDLVVLCDECHSHEHQIDEELREFIAIVGGPMQVLALAYGYFAREAAESAGVGYSGKDMCPYIWASGFIAYMCSQFDGPQLVQVANFIASISRPNSEPLQHWLHGGAREDMERYP